MQLIDNAFAVVTKAWSMRLMALAMVAEIIIDFPDLFDSAAAWVKIALLVTAMGARVVAQKGLSLPEDPA